MAYANSADPDQTAPEGAVWSDSTLFTIPLYILRNNCIKSKISVKTEQNKVFEISEQLFVLRPSQPTGVMLSPVSLPNHTFTGQA